MPSTFLHAASSRRDKQCESRNARRKRRKPQKAQLGLERKAQADHEEAMANGVIQQQQQGEVITLD